MHCSGFYLFKIDVVYVNHTLSLWPVRLVFVPEPFIIPFICIDDNLFMFFFCSSSSSSLPRRKYMHIAKAVLQKKVFNEF